MPTNMNDFVLELHKVIPQDKSIGIFPHARVDGDCVGSAVALCAALRKNHLNAYVYLEEAIPPRLAFMQVHEEEIIVVNPTVIDDYVQKIGLAIAVDCSDASRMGTAGSIFEKAPEHVVIDHHASSMSTGKLFYVDPDSASTAELIYQFICDFELVSGKMLMDAYIANNLMVGIQSDTGRFSYQNTTAGTLRIAADLMDAGANVCENAYYLFDVTNAGRVLLHGAAMSAMKLFAHGRIAITTIPLSLVDKTNAPEGAADGLVTTLRDIEGVNVAFVLRETEDGSIRVNVRSNDGFDASGFAELYGGGGHHRAAGFNGNNISMEDFYQDIVAKATAVLENK
ncbi:MAG TPA: DHH family phosphoesterase [Bacillota bacterium]|nr:DHH family phosphoesterase [Bacillota bacterium]